MCTLPEPYSTDLVAGQGLGTRRAVGPDRDLKKVKEGVGRGVLAAVQHGREVAHQGRLQPRAEGLVAPEALHDQGLGPSSGQGCEPGDEAGAKVVGEGRELEGAQLALQQPRGATPDHGLVGRVAGHKGHAELDEAPLNGHEVCPRLDLQPPPPPQPHRKNIEMT